MSVKLTCSLASNYFLTSNLQKRFNQLRAGSIIPALIIVRTSSNYVTRCWWVPDGERQGGHSACWSRYDAHPTFPPLSKGWVNSFLCQRYFHHHVIKTCQRQTTLINSSRSGWPACYQASKSPHVSIAVIGLELHWLRRDAQRTALFTGSPCANRQQYSWLYSVHPWGCAAHRFCAATLFPELIGGEKSADDHSSNIYLSLPMIDLWQNRLLHIIFVRDCREVLTYRNQDQQGAQKLRRCSFRYAIRSWWSEHCFSAWWQTKKDQTCV